jgi:hypothetical protein
VGFEICPNILSQTSLEARLKIFPSFKISPCLSRYWGEVQIILVITCSQVQCIKTNARNIINLNNLNIDQNLVVVVVKKWSLNISTTQHNVPFLFYLPMGRSPPYFIFSWAAYRKEDLEKVTLAQNENHENLKFLDPFRILKKYSKILAV